MCRRVTRLNRLARRATRLAQSCVEGAVPRSTGGPTGDEGDQAVQRGFVQAALTQSAILQRIAAQRRHAQALAERGLYGICEECHEPIGQARLKAQPEATRCVSCQRTREESSRAGGVYRPVASRLHA
jgi:DnaK suppressor protein